MPSEKVSAWAFAALREFSGYGLCESRTLRVKVISPSKKTFKIIINNHEYFKYISILTVRKNYSNKRNKCSNFCAGLKSKLSQSLVTESFLLII